MNSNQRIKKSVAAGRVGTTALLGSILFLGGCIDPRTTVEQRIDALPKPVTVVTCNEAGSLLRGADGSVVMVPGGFYLAKTLHAQGLKPGDVLVP